MGPRCGHLGEKTVGVDEPQMPSFGPHRAIRRLSRFPVRVTAIRLPATATPIEPELAEGHRSVSLTV